MDCRRFGAIFAFLLVALSGLGAAADARDATGPASSSNGIQRRPPRPGAGFPNLESYYPAEAKRAGQQGAAVIHFCVDAGGNLTGPPTIASSSGNTALDTAAVNLANAGNGHYLPGTQDGVAVQSCGEFRIKFELREDPILHLQDPRIPTISARIVELSTEYSRRLSEVGKGLELEKPPAQTAVDPVVIRQYARSLDSALDENVSIFADFLDDIEYLGKSSDIPDAERAIFREIWPDQRAGLAVRFREVLSAARDVVRAMDEMGDYITFSAGRHSKSGAAAQSQMDPGDAQLNAIRERGLNAVRKLEGSIEALSKSSP